MNRTRLLGVCERTFRRYIDRFEEAGLEGLIDRRVEEVSHRKAPVDEVVRLQVLYKRRYEGWNVQHFYERYRCEHGGERSYTWVKKRLQEAQLVEAGRRNVRRSARGRAISLIDFPCRASTRISTTISKLCMAPRPKGRQLTHVRGSALLRRGGSFLLRR